MYCCGNCTCGKCGDGENRTYLCENCTCGKCGEEGITCTVAVMVRAENAEKKESHVLLQ